MKHRHIIILLSLALFIDDNVLGILGYNHGEATSTVSTNPLFRIHPLGYACLLFFVAFLLLKRLTIRRIARYCRNELLILGTCVVILAYLFIVGRFNAVSFIVDGLMTPAIVSILCYFTKSSRLRKYTFIVYAAFGANLLLALFEKTSGTAVLNDFYVSSQEFRSSALYGHPLNNALIMSILGTLLYFRQSHWAGKVLILLGTITALLCFGARGAIIGVLACVVLSIIKDSSIRRPRKFILNIASLAFVCGVSVLILANTSLGDRILHRKTFVDDDSAAERIRSIALLSSMNSSQLQWGMSDIDTDKLMNKGKVQIIENYLVVWIAKFGIYFALAILLLLLKFTVKLVRIYDPASLIPILFAFWFIASINNSLASKTRAVSILAMGCYVLSKKGRTGNKFKQQLATTAAAA